MVEDVAVLCTRIHHVTDFLGQVWHIVGDLGGVELHVQLHGGQRL